GGAQRDVIIGGNGADTIVGGGGDDLMIAGSTSYDNTPAALRAIFAEWTSSRDFTTRKNNLLGVGSGTRLNGSYFLTLDKVFDDQKVDTLTGSGGQEWIFANTDSVMLDTITDLAAGEVVTDIDL